MMNHLKGADDDDDDDDDDDSDDDRRRNRDEKKKKKEKGRKKSRGHRRRRSPSSPSSSSDSSRSSSSDKKLDKKAVKKLIKALTGAASSPKDNPDSDKPSVKEAEKIVLPAFRNPETYGNWRLKAGEAVVAASDRTNKAFEWLRAVWNKDKTFELLCDPEGFATLDAKILPAVTNIVSGDFARQVDTFKNGGGSPQQARQRETSSTDDEEVLLDQRTPWFRVWHRRLLCVTMINEKLEVFMRNWHTVLSGIKKLPEETFLEPIFQSQIKKARVLQHDLNIYERALDGTPERTHRFFYDAAFRYMDESERIGTVKGYYQSVGGRPNPGVPAPPNKKYVIKGFCISFVRNGSCKKDGCKRKHEIHEERGRPRSKGRPSRPPTRENSPSSRPNKPRMCRFYKQSRCNKGDQCKFLHTGKPGAAATSGSGSSKSGSKGRGKGCRRRKDGSRRPSSKYSKMSKSSSQGSKGSGSKGNKNKPAPSVS